jgi:hypothetical protein
MMNYIKSISNYFTSNTVIDETKCLNCDKNERNGGLLCDACEIPPDDDGDGDTIPDVSGGGGDKRYDSDGDTIPDLVSDSDSDTDGECDGGKRCDSDGDTIPDLISISSDSGSDTDSECDGGNKYDSDGDTTPDLVSDSDTDSDSEGIRWVCLIEDINGSYTPCLNCYCYETPCANCQQEYITPDEVMIDWVYFKTFSTGRFNEVTYDEFNKNFP